ncbi:hypothetical protein QZH41_003945 [Actinostola sp. cb2023]|nr:hypothetical protein QZH41_003945 [Actinostola sp. cb2023]
MGRNTVENHPVQPFPPMMGPPPHGMPWDAGMGRGFMPNFRDQFPVGLPRPSGESPGRGARSDEDSEYASSEDERRREREHKKREKDKDRERSREHKERYELESDILSVIDHRVVNVTVRDVIVKAGDIVTVTKTVKREVIEIEKSVSDRERSCGFHIVMIAAIARGVVSIWSLRIVQMCSAIVEILWFPYRYDCCDR